MTKLEALESIKSSIPCLTDERLLALAELALSWSKPTVFSTLSSAEREQVDLAVDELDRGDSIELTAVEAKLEVMLKAVDA